MACGVVSGNAVLRSVLMVQLGLEQAQVRGSQGMLQWGHLRGIVRAGVGQGTGHAGLALAGQLECLDYVLACAKVGDKWEKWCSVTLERVLAVPCPFGRCCKVSKWIFFTYSLGAL